MSERQLPDWVKPGVSFQLYYQEDNPNNTRWHVRGIVDGMAVCREWWPNKRQWHYEVLSEVWFEISAPHIKGIET